jgi:hypothetical protein
MPFSYNTIVPWGRSFEEYRRMFTLTHDDLRLRILGCADGPASFNAQMFELGTPVVSIDPLYQFTAAQIEARIKETYEGVMSQMRLNQHQFNWSSIGSVEDLGRMRMITMRTFLADYDHGKAAGRYLAAELPDLPLTAGSFDLALCSHFLFFYSDHLSLDFHCKAIEAMCHVATEVRIFPLLNYNAEPSPWVERLQEWFTEAGYEVSLHTVPYEFQRGANQMMKVRRLPGG